MDNMDENDRKIAENEVQLLKVLKAPTIIHYYESFVENRIMNIVMEYAEGGMLTSKLDEFKKKSVKIPV